MCSSSPKGLFHASRSNGINDQYMGPGGQMAQLKAWGGCAVGRSMDYSMGLQITRLQDWPLYWLSW